MRTNSKIISMSGITQSENAKFAVSLLKAKPNQLKQFSHFKKNSTWLIKHRDGLRKDYGNMYVAVRHGKICSKSKNFPKLLKEVRAKYGSSQDVFIDYIGRDRISLLL